MKIIEKRTQRGIYDIPYTQAIIDHPKHGRILIMEGFSGGDVEGWACCWKYGLVAQLRAGDTFQTLDADWNDTTSVMDAVLHNHDSERALLYDWPGHAIANLAKTAGL